MPINFCIKGKKDFIGYLLNPRNWWLPLLLIFIISATGVTIIGIHTYTAAPPIPGYVSKEGKPVFTKEDMLDGQRLVAEVPAPC